VIKPKTLKSKLTRFFGKIAADICFFRRGNYGESLNRL